MYWGLHFSGIVLRTIFHFLLAEDLIVYIILTIHISLYNNSLSSIVFCFFVVYLFFTNLLFNFGMHSYFKSHSCFM